MQKLLLSLLLLAPLAQAQNMITPWAGSAGESSWTTPWRVADIPKLQPPQRSVVDIDGRNALQIRADSAAGGLLFPLDLPGDKAWQLSWQWRIDKTLKAARFATREGDDYAARVYVLLDYPLDTLPFLTRQKIRLARTFYDSNLPVATLSYVWDNREKPGTHARSAYTEQVEMRVLRGPETAVQEWQEEQRDLRADAIAAFGSAPSKILGVVFAADSDNTGESLVSYFAKPVLQNSAP
ncbi:hypothetical protein AX279_22555 [Pseudomonas sp. J237]|nr:MULTISPECIES: DUF3047 domain-containing protein [Pseudomonas]OEO23107.1 hypothetical protein AX279_22555 [Pseudomonas sp. J237]